MKKLVASLLLIAITTISAQAEETVSEIARGTLYAEYTEAYAHDIGYYALFNSLRTRVAEFMRILNFRMRKYIQDLRFLNKQLRADAESYDLNTMLENLEIAFDAFFLSADTAFITIGSNMDKNDNTPQEKKLFIMREKDRLSKSVEKMIKESSVRFAQALS